MTQPHIHVRGATTSICRRTSFRKAFLAPWHPEVNEIWLYSLAYAAQEHDVSVHMSKLAVTHHHTDVTPSKANLPKFVKSLHSDVSCAVNQLLIRERYDAPRNVWDGREPHYLRLLDGPAQLGHLTYDYVQGPAAGLVERPEQMPGRQLEVGLWASDGLVVKRPDVYFDDSRPSELLLKLEPPPLLMRAFGGDVQAAIHHMRKLVREALREIRRARKWPAMGAQKLKRMHPSDEPRTQAEPGGQRIPTFKVGTRGDVGRQTRIRAAQETSSFRQEHAEMRAKRFEGKDVKFPFGTYGQRVFHGAKTKEPYDDALLAQPGPLLHEVLAELEQDDREPVDREAMLEKVREVLVEEAPTLVEESELDFRKPDPSGRTGDGERPEPETIHRMDPKRQYRENPRRLIVRRDARRGRPKNKRPGSDPPSE